MKLHEIIEINEDHEKSVLIEKMIPYKKMLYTYFQRQFSSEPILMVTEASNAAQYAKIVPIAEFAEAVCAYMGVGYVIEDSEEEDFDEDLFAQYETICFNSRILKDL
jgi:hypothetical protein